MSEQNGEPFRDFLDRREAELLRSINALHGQLRPQESELAEIRRAKGALGIPILHLVVADSGAGVEIRSAEAKSPLETQAAPLSGEGALHADAAVIPAAANMGVNRVNPAPRQVATMTVEPANDPPPAVPHPASYQNNSCEVAGEIAVAHHGVRRRRIAEALFAIEPNPYQNLTMKQLVVRALTEHFQNGATAKQLREFFRDAWGREMERHNLSPQLSRLRADEIIELNEGIWRLTRGFRRYGTTTPFGNLKDELPDRDDTDEPISE
jgi:hypothetical protein